MRALDRRVETVIRLFRDLFECEGRLFGNPVAGISDGVEGVQWNASYAQAQGIAWLGVNLEGMLYDGWPVARLIERELSDPHLLRYRDRIPSPETVTVSWRRDAWQVQSRPPIREARVCPTPIKLDQLDDDGWEQALLGARGMLGSRARIPGTPQGRGHVGPFAPSQDHGSEPSPLVRDSAREEQSSLDATGDEET